MRIQVRVVPGSTQEKVEMVETGLYKVWVRVIPEKGKATAAVQRVLAKHFGVVQRKIHVQHTTSRIKWIDILM
jgi:uncharacterized protein